MIFPATDRQRRRIDHWIERGIEVPAFFDPMLAKLICHGEDRADALQELSSLLAECQLYGIETNQRWLQALLQSPEVQSGRVLTRTLASFTFTPQTRGSVKRRHPEHAAGLPGPRRLLAYRRAPLRPHG